MTSTHPPHAPLGWERLLRFKFGDGGPMADELLQLVLQGKKTATCWSAETGKVPPVGYKRVVLDSGDGPRAVIETVAVELLPFNEVPLSFMQAEGEGDLSVESWTAGHKRFFTRNGGYSPDMLLVCEYFRVAGIIAQAFAE